jgi:putative transcriptional regulator
MLIAMPSMGDERFARSVIYVCAHSVEGAMGIVVNQPAPHISFPDLLVQLDVVPAADLIQLPTHAGGLKVLKGGPVDTQRGFVLHSSDFFIENSTLPIDEASVSPQRWTSSRPSRAAMDLAAQYWRWAMPGGRRANWRTRSSITAGCIAPPMPS